MPLADLWRLTKLDYGYGDQMTPETDLDAKKRDQLKEIEQIKALA